MDRSARWQDTAKSFVGTSIRSIIASIIAEALELVAKLAEAERQRQFRHQAWTVSEDRRQREDDPKRIEESEAPSAADLLKIIDRWADRTSVERFPDGVERSFNVRRGDEKQAILDRLTLARVLLGTQDPFDFFQSGQTPHERYLPRFFCHACKIVIPPLTIIRA